MLLVLFCLPLQRLFRLPPATVTRILHPHTCSCVSTSSATLGKGWVPHASQKKSLSSTSYVRLPAAPWWAAQQEGQAGSPEPLFYIEMSILDMIVGQKYLSIGRVAIEETVGQQSVGLAQTPNHAYERPTQPLELVPERHSLPPGPASTTCPQILAQTPENPYHKRHRGSRQKVDFYYTQLGPK